MFPLAGGKEVYLTTGGRKRAGRAASDAEEKKFGNVPEIVADATGVGSAVLTNLVPEKVRLVLKAPSREDIEPTRKERVRNPEITVGGRAGEGLYGEGSDLIEREGGVNEKGDDVRGLLCPER